MAYFASMIVRTPRDIGSMIRSRRQDLGWDQQTLADRIGVGRLWVIGMERGKPGVQLDLVLRALAAVGLQIDMGVPDEAPPSMSAGWGAGKSRSGMLIDRLLGDDDL